MGKGRFRSIVFCAAGILWATSAAAGQIVLDQHHDFRDRSLSYDGALSGRTADDFIDMPLLILRVTVEMIVTFPNQPDDYRLDLYLNSSSGGPGQLVHTFAATRWRNRGSWNGNPNLRLVEVEFDDDFQQGAGWLSPYGIGGDADTRSWWGTAGNGSVNFSEGYFMSDDLGFPDWTPVSDPDLLGFETDFAMRIESLPAPSAFAVFGLVLIGAKRRRRERGAECR